MNSHGISWLILVPGAIRPSGGAGVWYASSNERGAWAELFRHWGTDEVSPFEVRRRVGRARVSNLAVLDLTDTQVRDEMGVIVDDVVRTI